MSKFRAAAFFCTVLLAIGAFALQYPQPSSGQMGTSPSQQATPPSQSTQPSQTPSTPDTPATPSQSAQPSGQGPGGSQGQSNIDAQVRILSDQLTLTQDQQTKVRSILVDQHEQAMTLVKDSTLSREDKMAKIHTLREGTISKVRELLTTDQKPKFDQMIQAQDERMRERQQGGPGSSPSTMPPSSTSPSSTPPDSSSPNSTSPSTPPGSTPPPSSNPGSVKPPQ